MLTATLALNSARLAQDEELCRRHGISEPTLLQRAADLTPTVKACLLRLNDSRRPRLAERSPG